MSYICLNCGNIFGEGEQVNWVESHGENWDGCPCCGGDFEKAVKCKICGAECLEDELNGGCVCDECIEEYSKDFDTCYKISTNEKEEIKINALLASVLNVKEIETILYHYLKIKNDVDCYKFVEQDKDWFAEKLAEEVSK